MVNPNAASNQGGEKRPASSWRGGGRGAGNNWRGGQGGAGNNWRGGRGGGGWRGGGGNNWRGGGGGWNNWKKKKPNEADGSVGSSTNATTNEVLSDYEDESMNKLIFDATGSCISFEVD